MKAADERTAQKADKAASCGWHATPLSKLHVVLHVPARIQGFFVACHGAHNGCASRPIVLFVWPVACALGAAPEIVVAHGSAKELREPARRAAVPEPLQRVADDPQQAGQAGPCRAHALNPGRLHQQQRQRQHVARQLPRADRRSASPQLSASLPKSRRTKGHQPSSDLQDQTPTGRTMIKRGS